MILAFLYGSIVFCKSASFVSRHLHTACQGSLVTHRNARFQLARSTGLDSGVPACEFIADRASVQFYF